MSEYWALAPVGIRGLDEEHFLLLRNSDGSSGVLDVAWKPVLPQLEELRTLADHAKTITDQFPVLEGNTAAVEALLGQLVEQGLFQSAGQLADETRQAARTQPPPTEPPSIVIVTCERPDTLARLVDSLAANEERYGNRWRYEVIDDSRAAQVQQQNRDSVRNAGKRLDIEYLGPEDQRTFLDSLFRDVPEARDVRWLLERDGTETEPTYGIPKNLALLRHAGRRLLLLDDDTVIRTARLPGWGRVPRFDREHLVQACIDVEEARRQVEPYDQDPLAAHAAALGHAVSDVINEFADEEAKASFIGEKMRNLVTFRSQESRVTYTMNGLVGDPGTNSDIALFSSEKSGFRGIAADEARYLELKQSGRVVFRGSPWPSFYNNGWLLQATCLGLDGSGYLPPVYPSGRGEDTLLGILLKLLYPQDFGLALPFTMEHLPAGKRAWRFDPDIFVFDPTVNRMLMGFAAAVRVPGHYPPARKMALFADVLKHDLEMAGSRQPLQGKVRVSHLKQLSSSYRMLSKALESMDDASPSWERDVEALQDEIIEQLGAPPAIADDDEKRLRSGLLRYADAIEGWNRLYEYRRTQGG